jgi:hypothetical protein
MQPSTLKVYFIENVETGRIKIGFTTRPVVSRVAALQTGSDCELRLLGAILASEALGTTELQLHRKLSQWRHRGEWFTRDVLPVVRQLLQESLSSRAQSSTNLT